jgi:formate dehydrogenase major subunit
VRLFEGPLNHIAHTPTAEYPVVATTFRLTEHYLSGPMSRFNSWLNELQPEMFVELSPELAAERGIEHGGWLTVQSARGRVEARAMVTRRLRPLHVEGREPFPHVGRRAVRVAGKFGHALRDCPPAPRVFVRTGS